MKKCINFFIAFLCCLFFSCDMEIEEILRQKRLEYISVDTTEAVKLEYLIGENFNSEGIKIYGHYSDETQVEEDLRLVSFSGFDSSQAAEKNTITVLFNEKETTFDVKIHESKIEKIQIIQKPIKQFFRVGESNDTTGIIVKAIYTNGNETPLAEDEYILEGFDSSKAGMCLVNVILKADTKIYDAYTVVFQDYDIKEIKISKNPNKLIYMVGEELDLTGLEVYATPENGLPPFLLPQYNYSPASIKDITATGKQTITINVNEVKASFDIEIVDAYVKGFVVKDKDGNGKPKEGIIEDSKRIYCAGDTFKLEHFAFYELYSNDAIGQVITSDNGKMEKLSFVFDGEEHGYEDECQFGDEPGVYTIPIRYEFEDITTKENTSSTIEIKVCVTDSEIDGIEASWSGGSGYPKWITPDNSKPEYGNWTVNAILKTEDKIDITNMCSFEYTVKETNRRTPDNEGKVEVTVKYHDIRTNNDFEITEKVEVRERILQKVEIVTLPKTDYVEGENVSLIGLKVKGTYSDGRDVEIEENKGFVLEQIDNNNEQIKVLYEDGVTCTIPIKRRPNDVIGIRVEARTDRIPQKFYFRKGKLYDSQFFDYYFSVYPRKKIEDIPSEKINISELNYTIKEGAIIIVYNSDGGTYSKIHKDDEKEITILPALPTSVEIEAGDGTYAGLDNIKTSKNTQLHVKYGSVENETLTNNNGGTFTDEVGSYVLNIEGDKINVVFTKSDLAVDESESERTITFKNVLSKNKIIVKNENGFNDEFSFKQENDEYGFAQKYCVCMEFNNGQRQKIESNSLTFTPLLTSYNYEEASIEDKLLVNYTDTTDTSYYCTYYNVTYLPPKPSTIDVDLKVPTDTGVSQEPLTGTGVSQDLTTDTGESEEESTDTEGSQRNPIIIKDLKNILDRLSWTVTYEDGSVLSKEDSELPENSEDQRWKPTFQISNNLIELEDRSYDSIFTKIVVNQEDDIYKIEVDREILFFKLEKKPPEATEEAVGGENP